MTSRTFPLSRQRRRRIVPQGAGSPSGDAVALEREPAPTRTAAGVPADPATHSAGARPAAPRLPHEHDENADASQPPRESMIQAEADLAQGRQDTDLRGKAREVFDAAATGRDPH